MKRSEWITLIGIASALFASTIGSALYLPFKIGGVNEKVTSLETRSLIATTQVDTKL